MNVHHRWATTALLVAVSFGVVGAANAVSTFYTITDLGTLGGNYSYATGINNSGQVVGNSSTVIAGINTDRPFLYSNGMMTNLGTPLGGAVSRAAGINNSGQVVGDWSSAPTPDVNLLPFLYSNGTMTDLGAQGGGATFSHARSINDSGQIAGYSYYWGERPGFGWVEYYSAFINSNGTTTVLGTLGGLSSYAEDINNSGQVVGKADIDPNFVGLHVGHAYLYSNGTMTDLHTLGGGNRWSYSSYASGINNSGQVVGGFGAGNPFLYSNGTMFQLNDWISPGSGWSLTSASDINDLGQIVGYGSINGQKHAYLATPYSVAAVPVPAAVWLLGSGLLGLVGMARRKT